MSSECYVYAIFPATSPLPVGLIGLDDRPIWTIATDGLAAAVSAPGKSPPHPTMGRLMRHEAIVEAIGYLTPSLPVRFGTVLADAATVVRALHERATVLADDLRRVGGRVELGVTLLVEADDTAEKSNHASDAHEPLRRAERTEIPALQGATGEGGAYLRARMAQHHREGAARTRGAALAGRFDNALGTYAVERRISVCPGPRLLLRAYYLLDPSHVEDARQTFDQTLCALRGTHPDIRCLLSGPWPPYTFVSEDLNGGQSPRTTSALLDPAWLAQIL